MCRRTERQSEYQLVPLGKGGDAESEELLEPPLRRVPSHWDVPDLGSAGAWKKEGHEPSTCDVQTKTLLHFVSRRWYMPALGSATARLC